MKISKFIGTIAIALGLMTMSVYADSTAVLKAPGATGNSSEVTSSELGAYFDTSAGKQYLSRLRSSDDGGSYSTSKYGTLSVGNKTYYITQSEYDTLVNRASTMKTQEISADGGLADVNDDLNNLTSNFNTRPDLATASEAVSGIQGMVSLVIGVFLIIACLFVTFFSAVDIIYLAWPVFREKAETNSRDGGFSVTKFVSDEAKFAVKKASTDANGKSVWGIYLPKRAIAYIGLGLALYILFTGNITVLTGLAIKFASGIFNALKLLG